MGDKFSLNNQKFRDNRGWDIGQGSGDIWEIGKLFGDKISLKISNSVITGGGRLDEDLVIDGRLGED